MLKAISKSILRKKKILESKLDNLGTTAVAGTGGVSTGVPAIGATTAVNANNTRSGAVVVDRQTVHTTNQTNQTNVNVQNQQFVDQTLVTQGHGEKTVKVIEHVHPLQREENVIRHDAPVEHRTVVQREIIPNEQVEIHKHVHPVEKIDIHEHHKQRETEVVKEKVHETHVREIHEHSHPKTRVEVDKEIVHPEIVVEKSKVVDLGEVSRDVVEKEVDGRRTHHH